MNRPGPAEILERAARAGRLHHGIILAGRRGVGKLALARRLAQIANCTGTATPCGSCSACRRIAQDKHPDVQRIVPESATLKVDQVRGILADAESRPYEGRRRVFILEEAEKLHPAAANALLKSLEEPRSEATFVLLTTSAERLLPTIRSRSIEFVIPAPAADAIAAELARDQPQLGEMDRRWLARWRAASPATELDAAELRSAVEPVVAALERAGERGVAAGVVVELAARFKTSDLESTSRLLLFVLRDLWLAAHGAEDADLVNEPWAARLRQAAARLPPAGIAEAIGRLLSLPPLAPLNLGRQAQLEWSLFPLAVHGA